MEPIDLQIHIVNVMHREARKAACFAASRFRRHLLVHAMQMRRAACFWRGWDFRPMKPFIHLFIDYMFKSPPTQASSTVTSAQRKVEVHLAKFELAQMKNIELIKQNAHARDKKEIYEKELNILEKYFNVRIFGDMEFNKIINENLAELQTPSRNTMKTPYGNLDPIRMALLILKTPELTDLGNHFRNGRKDIHDKQHEISSLKSSIEEISKNQESSRIDLKESKMELTQAINALRAFKPSAPNESELDHFINIAAQKIAASNSSIAKLTLSEAQKDLLQAESAMINFMTELIETSKEIDVLQHQYHLAQVEFHSTQKYTGNNFNSPEFLADFLFTPKHKQMHENLQNSLRDKELINRDYNLLTTIHASAQKHVDKLETEFEKSKKILEHFNSEVARAKLALEQHIPDNDLTSCINGAILTDASPAPATDHSQAIEEHHLEEQVVQVGTNNTCDIP